MKRQGIILIMAGGFNYGVMALNLALSIKNKSNISICLLVDKNDLAYHHLKECLNQDNISINDLFNDIIQIPDKYIKDNKVNFSLLKLSLYSLSPYNKTIYIDLDSCILNTNFIDKTIKQLDNIQIIYQTDGYKKISGNDSIYNNLTTWKEYSDFFNLNINRGVPQIHSYFFAFKKHDITDCYFTDLLYFYNKLENNKELVKSEFYGNVSDEVVIHLTLNNSPYWLNLYRDFIFTPFCDFNIPLHRKNINKFSGVTFCGSWDFNKIAVYERISINSKRKGLKHRLLKFDLLDNYYTSEFLK